MCSHSNEYTQYTIFNILRKITLNYPKIAAMGLFPGTQERVRNNHGKRAISVRATDELIFMSRIKLSIEHEWEKRAFVSRIYVLYDQNLEV